MWLNYRVVTTALNALAERLDIGLHSRGVCPACLGSVAIALDTGDERKVAREITSFAPFLWGEGLGDSVRIALEVATRGGDDDTRVALRELAAKGARSGIFRAIVRRLAVELAEEARRARLASLN